MVKENTKIKYEEILSDIISAQKNYPSILTTKNDVLKINIEAILLNSEIFVRVNLVRNKVDSQKHFLDLRKNINELKSLINKVSRYENYPEFQHTEAILELHESEFIVDKEKKLHKLECAKKAMESAINTANNLKGFKTSQYLDDLKLIENKISAIY